jgi:hypothetical protein
MNASVQEASSVSVMSVALLTNQSGFELHHIALTKSQIKISIISQGNFHSYFASSFRLTQGNELLSQSKRSGRLFESLKGRPISSGLTSIPMCLILGCLTER